MRLKTVDSSNRTKFFWKEFHCERGRCYLMKALSPNVIFNQTAGVEKKNTGDLRLYKDELNINK